MILATTLTGLPQASTFAGRVDALFGAVFWFSVVSLGLVTLAIIYFMIRYHRSRRDPAATPYIEGHDKTELTVCFVLFVIFMAVFAWGWRDYRVMLQAPGDAIEINVTGRQWSWEFEYTNGRKMVNEVVVPRGRPVKLLMTSADVIHSFFVPAFRVKQDVVPGAYTSLWFEPTTVGEYQVFCAEYCGTAHSKMLATLRVMEPAEYETWHRRWEFEVQTGRTEQAPATGATLPTAPPPTAQDGESLAVRGKRLFTEKGCTACHSDSGGTGVGPPLNGMFGTERPLQGGVRVVADENYVRESLMDPQAKIVNGFPPVMPTFRGTLTDDDINALVHYIKRLSEGLTSPPPAAKPLEPPPQRRSAAGSWGPERQSGAPLSEGEAKPSQPRGAAVEKQE